jgi:hypothetical protein
VLPNLCPPIPHSSYRLSVLLALNEENGIIVQSSRIFEMEPSTVWTLQLETPNFGDGIFIQKISFYF